jgi:hypothetical protein
MKHQAVMMIYKTKVETASGFHSQAAKQYSTEVASITPMKKSCPSGIFCTSWQASPQSSIYWNRKEQKMYQNN